MPSNSPSWFKSPIVVGATQVAAATILALGVVSYTTGDTYQAGTQEVTTASGTTTAAGGGVFIATNLGNAACLKDTRGRYYNCYQATVLTNSGGCVAAGCSSKSYNPGAITKPYTGSGVLKLVQVTCDGSHVATTLSVGQVASVNSSGSNVWLRKSIGTGAHLSHATGSTIWSELTPIVKASAGVRLGATNCLLEVVSDEMYNP